MTVELSVFRKTKPRSFETFVDVEQLAQRFLVFLNSAEIQEGIAEVHQVGASSAEIQNTILPGTQQLGFTPEKKGLFQAYAVPALRPDYYLQVRDTGILLEVERGKTTTNNMDLLDLWKCHICEHAEYLFLLVPQVRPTLKGSNTRPFKQVQSRLGTFFRPNNYVNVEAVFLFGY
jgi:hypothetical protein